MGNCTDAGVVDNGSNDEGDTMGSEYLTMAEIDARYPNEWVLIASPKFRRRWGELIGELLGGFVVLHSDVRDEFDRRLLEFTGNGMTAVHYTGEHCVAGLPRIDWEE